MEKIKIYISSRANTKSAKLDKTITLSDLRLFLRETLEKESFLDEELLEIIIHENNFAPDTSQDPHQLSLSKLDECNIVFILYNGDSGWNPSFSGNGICHDEFLKAVDEYSTMTHIIDVSHNFPFKKAKEKDEAFQQSVRSFTMEQLKASTVDDLHEKILTQIKSQVINDLKKSLIIQKQVVKQSSIFGETLEYSKMTYSQREYNLRNVSKKKLDTILPNVHKMYHVIPDNMSVSDARNRIGRPFINEADEINDSYDAGIVHFITVYGNCTEIQIKNLVGFPDLTVIKTPFGFYLWDTTNHIQMFFLAKCKNGNAIGTNINYVLQWLHSSKENENITKRAQARYSILMAIKNSKNLL